MPSTVILEPLNDVDDKNLAEKNYWNVATLMNEMNNFDVTSFSDISKDLEIIHHSYLLAVRSSLYSPNFFLKRLHCEISQQL